MEVKIAKDLDMLKVGDSFIYKNREFILYRSCPLTIADDYEIFKVWNSNHKVITLKIPANNYSFYSS